jgi:type I restriction enzyme S subunit
MVKLASGASYPAVTDKIVKHSALPLPPVGEQRRIAAVLDAADELRAKRRQALAKLDALTKAIFIDMFGDPYDPRVESAPLSDLADIVMGQSPPGASYNDFGDGTPLLNGPTEFGSLFPIAVQWTTTPTRMSQQGDILFCVRGATAGRMNWSDREYCLGRGLAAIRTEPGRRAFLYRVLESYYPRFQAAGVGSTFINISKKDLLNVPIPVASSERVAQFGELQEKVDSLKTVAEQDGVRLDTLFASLQQRAFRGDL